MSDVRDDRREDRRGAAADKAADKTADKARADAEKARVEAEKKQDEARKVVHDREVKAAQDAFNVREAEIAAEREKKEEAQKEADRLAKLSPEAREAEISPFAATVPHHPVLQSPHPPTEFVLSEANGHRSRGNAYIADPATIYVGQPLKKTAEATPTQPPTYVPAAAGADCQALALYAGGTIPGEGLRISVICRDAEVNGLCISWGAITAPEQAIGIATLATQGIIVRL